MDPFISDGGHANLHSLLVSLGLQQWKLPASFFVLVALGIWTYHYRREDLWLLLGVTGIVARLWSYHLMHDDLLIVFSEVALYRTVRQRQLADSTGILAAVLLTLTLLLMLPPPTRLFLFWPSLFRAAQVFVWLCVLVFLISQARRNKHSM
jgi:asparagine N-glycosylation enzyme membrane subunit Stt3